MENNTNEKAIKVNCITLGCDKNRVDTEKILANLLANGYVLTSNVYEADLIFINTCAFIQKAREEAINEIVFATKVKEENKNIKIVVAGCFPQFAYQELQQSFPEVDLFVKIRDYGKIVSLINGLFGVLSKPKKILETERFLTLQNSSSAFLKIADGCDNCCSYCTIPRIRGRYHSAFIDELVVEAEKLAKKGVREIILVAQDVTRYGEDIYGENRLVDLLKELSKIKDISWIRLHYLYPEKISDELLDYMDNCDKVCKYLDIPLQHCSDKILSLMNRRTTRESIETLLHKIRSLKHKFVVRSTFIVGYPGEGKQEFKDLCEFIKVAQLDNVGFFKYSKEEKTPSYFQKNHVSNFVKSRRIKIVQKIQNGIATKHNLNRIGSVVNVIVDYYDSVNRIAICRDQYNSIDVDYIIQVKTDTKPIEKFAKIKIISYNDYVFEGEIL